MKSLKKLTTFLFDSLLLIALTACQIGTAAPAYLTVTESTNCRTGPGEAYEIVFTYLSGTQLEIVGRYDPGNFWLVKSAESPTGTCWMWGEYVEVTGNYLAVSSVTPPPLLTSAPSQTLFVEKWEYSCNGGTLTFTLSWRDRATDEAGYRIFRNDQLLVELPADSTAYTDTFSPEAGENVNYYLQVHRPSGSVNSSVMSMSC